MGGKCPECGTSNTGQDELCTRCGGALRGGDRSDPLIDRTIADKYLIRSLLGSGAMGRIYVAEHTALERTVALKVLHPHLAYNESIVHRFLREARAASRLAHPNIVTLLDFGQDPEDGLLYLVMEYLEGRSLQAIIEGESPLELDRVISLARQVLLALDEAHAEGIVHRDLKPENIIVQPTRQGERVKVVDFGLAQLMGGDDPRLTSTGLVCGTPSYISPEQARASDVGPATDIYSFGVMLYEMVAGVLPFDATGAYEMVSKHLTELPPPPDVRAPDRTIPRALTDLIMSCLEKSPPQRPASAAEVHDALLEVEQSGHGPLRAPSSPLEAVPTAPSPLGPAEESRPCTSCGHDMPTHARFCGVCGADMEEESGQSGAAPSAPAAATEPVEALERLRRFVPPKVLDAVLHGDELLASQRRQVTVLFAEVLGVSSVAGDPEEMVQVINRCFDVLVQAVDDHDGTVDKLVGDCVMAVFGAPVSHEDDPLRALQAAFAMRESVGRLRRTLPLALSLRVGLSTGTVVAGPVGGAARVDYTVVGETVRLAQRLASLAGPGEILVTEEVYRDAGAAFQFKPRPSVRLESNGARVAAFEAEGARPRRARPATPPPVTFLVGRAAERTLIAEATQDLLAARGGSLLFTGEAGIGKTALLVHAAQTLGAQKIATHMVRGRPSDTAGSGALGHLLRSLLACPPDATEGQVQGRLDAMDGLDTTDRAALAFLAVTSRSSASLPAGALDLTCITALRRLLRLVAAVAPTAILLDDARHLCSRERHLIAQLAEGVASMQILIIVADRQAHPELIDAGLREVKLGPMHPVDAERLLRKLAGDRPVDSETVQRVLESSGGNPLYIVETARYLEREGRLAAETPRQRRQRAITVPGNLRALVLSRFDELDPLAQTVLVHAALVGRAFAPSLLARLMPGERGLQASLEELEEAGLLEREDAEGANPKLQFRHELVREILCDTLTRDRRRAVHQRIADLLLEGADPSTPPGEIGRQLELAGRDTDAADQFDQAAREHKDRGEPEEAARYLRRAVVARERAGDVGSHRTVDLSIRLAAALNRAGHWDEARRTALETRNRALPTGDVILATRASRELARAAAEQGDLPLADSVLGEAVQTAFECGELDLAAALSSDLGEVQERTGKLEQALGTLEAAHRRLEAASRRTRISQAGAASARVGEVLNRLGRVMLRMERVDDARDRLEKALKHANVAGDPGLTGKVLGNLGQAQAAAGERAAALQTLHQALETLRRAGDRVGTAKLLHNMARLHLDSGQREQAEALARESFDLSVEIGWREGEAMGAAFLDQMR